MKYRPEIDGLRSLAVLPVIFFHAGFGGFSGGYVGVDIFFVISGYLITTIVYTEVSKDKFSILQFYERRARRILPALFFMCAGATFFAWMLLLPKDFQSFSQSLVSVVLFSSNFFFWLESGYFDPVVELKPLLHTWSLAVEEQYYIFFPLLIMALNRFGRKWIVISLVIIFLASLSLAEFGSFSFPEANFYLLPTRAWELLIGSLAALYLLSRNNGRDSTKGAISEVLSIFGVILVLVSIFLFDENTRFPSFYGLVPTLGTLLIIVYSKDSRFVYKVLSSRILVSIGLVSYSAYLWHQPIFAFARYYFFEGPSRSLMCFLILLTFLLAWFSYRFIEAPFRNKDKIERKYVFKASLFFSAVIVAFGISGHMTMGYASRIEMPPNVEWISLGDKIAAVGEICDPAPVSGYPGLSVCYFGNQSSKKVVGLYGDSHAKAISYELASLFNERAVKGVYLKLMGCEIVPSFSKLPISSSYDGSKCRAGGISLQRYVADKLDRIIVASRWTYRLYPTDRQVTSLLYDNGEGGVEIDNYIEFGAVIGEGKTTFDPDVKRSFVESFLAELSKEKQVILLYPIPEVGWNIFRKNYDYFRDNKGVLEALSVSESSYYQRNEFILSIFKDLANRNDNFVPIRTDKLFCSSFIEKRCVAQFGGVPFYYDDDHLSGQGAKIVVDAINDVIM